MIRVAKKNTSNRKKEHIELCLTDKVAFSKTNGLDAYEFEPYAITEVDFSKIDLSTKLFGKNISYPFIISCMTGGTTEAERINEKLALVAKELNIPIGVGSQRQALENKSLHSTYKVVRKNAGNVPVIGNIGAAQVASSQNILEDIQRLIDLIEADAMVIHLNPLQELLQKEGEPNFSGLLKSMEKITKQISIPIVVKEVGCGIDKHSARKLLNVGVQGIDVAGAGGTSWSAVELLRNKREDEYFKEWGLPTSYCIRTIAQLKKKNKFTLIASGGIKNGVEIAKSIALGADLAGSARIILQEIIKSDVEGTQSLLQSWFNDLKRIMYLTGCSSVKKLQKVELQFKKDLI